MLSLTVAIENQLKLKLGLSLAIFVQHLFISMYSISSTFLFTLDISFPGIIAFRYFATIAYVQNLIRLYLNIATFIQFFGFLALVLARGS